MRISVAAFSACAALLASTAAFAAEPGAVGQTDSASTSRFSAGLGLEVTLVGLAVGLRPELLYRLGPPGTVSHLRTSVGLLFGPEFTLVPASIGYRAVWRQDKTVQPIFGAGWQSNFFLVSSGNVFSQLGVVYFEGGSAFAVNNRISAGALATLDWSFINERGPGLGVRAFGTWKF